MRRRGQRWMTGWPQLRQGDANPAAPELYGGWEDTITVGLTEPKKQLTLRLDAEVVQWFEAQGKDSRR